MIAHLSPQVPLHAHPASRAETRARFAGLALAAAGHAALLLWLVSQTFRPIDLTDNTPLQPPLVMQTVDLTPPQPAPKSAQPPTNAVHAISAPVSRSVEPLPVRVASLPTTGPVAINPFINPGIGGAPDLTIPAVSHVLTNPDWIARPTADQVAQAYPEAALREGIAGSVTLSCQVTAGGGVIGCKVNAETPQARGFGHAALGLARYFRIRPGTYDGEPVEGASVLIPVRFRISG